MRTVGQFVAWFERFAPRVLAESWDNTGLLLGDRDAPVERVMTCLTVTPESAAEAVERKASLIVTHHPVLFRARQRLTADDAEGRVLLALIRAGVTIYSPHTSYDSAEAGINVQIAARLGLTDTAPLRPAAGPPSAKLTVFVPQNDLERVSRAMFDAGAGTIGEYRECSFRAAGTGTFFGSEASHPTVGQPGRREQVDEWRLEVRCPQPVLPQIIAAMRAAHSYEEPAFDVYPLWGEPSAEGGGRRGALPRPVPLYEFARSVKAIFASRLVEVAGDPRRIISCVAIGCGSGGEFLADAVAQGCDVLMTGEATFHRVLEARARGIGLVLAGHYATERFAVDTLAARLAAEFAPIEVWASAREQDPLWTAP